MNVQKREQYDEIGEKIKTDYSDATSSSCHHQDHHQMGERRYNNLVVAPGTLNTVTPCAACKLQRKKCAQECPFSPYFSPHEPHKFASVHKVFGASNVSKLLMKVPESQRADVANTLVYEANARLRDPVYGCMGAISALRQQLHSSQVELDEVRAAIIKYSKYRDSHNTPIVFVSSHSSLDNLPSSSIEAQPTKSLFCGGADKLKSHQNLISAYKVDAKVQPSSTASDYSTMPSESHISLQSRCEGSTITDCQ